MQRSGFPSDPTRMCVCDASFWINLVATGRAEPILRAIQTPMVITDVALGELERGRAKGRTTADAVDAMVERGLVGVVSCAPDDEELFLTLVVGTAAETLDDGEAATLVYAARSSIVAVIDERKATSLAASRFPDLGVRSTLDILLGAGVIAAMGHGELSDAVFGALTEARMRVPPHRLQDVVNLLGAERAARCPSLPAPARRQPGYRVAPPASATGIAGQESAPDERTGTKATAQDGTASGDTAFPPGSRQR